MAIPDYRSYHKNPRKINEKQLKELSAWMEELGDLSGIIVDTISNEIIGGNQRSKILKEGEWVIQEVKPKEKDGTVGRGWVKWKGTRFNLRHVEWTPEQCERANIIANAAGGEWDFEILGSDAWNTGQLLEFFTKEQLPFIANESKEVKEDNFKVDPPEDPLTRPGDVYQLDRHRVRCGDSTTPSEIRDLMQGGKARCVFTDPPYGVSYDGAKIAEAKSWKMINNDDLRDDGLFKFLSLAFEAMADVTMDSAAIYCFYASRNHIIFETAMNSAGWVVKQQLIWEKGHVMGRSDYHWCHEPILYGHKEEVNSQWFGDRTHRTTIMDGNKSDITKMTKDQLIEILRTIKAESDIWGLKRDAGSTYEHPTQKPITLAAKGILNSTVKDDIVLDPFGGAGFVLLAAEQMDRIAYTQENDPAYVDVIVKRWLNWKFKQGESFVILKNGEEIPQTEIDKYMKYGH